MKMRLLSLLLVGIAVAYGQTTAGEVPQTPPPPDQTQTAPPDQAQTPAPNTANRTVISTRPGSKLIKPKDYSGQTGYFHPFVRMGQYFAVDQKKIWTSPFHTPRKEAKYWLIFGGITGGLIATDKYVARNAPNGHTLQTLGTDVSYLGEPYTLIPIAAGWYFLGTAFHSDHFRETGLLAFETLADVTVEMEVMKAVFDRQRPLEGNGDGEFGASKTRYNASFPSGHALETMALASVFVHEYPHKTWLKVLVYSYVAGVCGARLAANRHFPGDVAAGAAMGWFTGDYVYGKRHNPALDKKHSAENWLLDHVHIGFGM